MSLVALVCLWTACSAPRHSQVSSTIPSHGDAITAVADEAPQAAQSNSGAAAQTAEEPVLLASNEPATVSADGQLDNNLKTLAAERPQLARKLGNAVREAQSNNGKAAPQAKMAKAANSLRKVMAKAEKKFDVKKAEGEKAAQANTSLVALGALLAVGGLVLLLVTSGTAQTIGVIALVVGLVLLLISLLS
jgi:hypothetical protein